MTEVVVVTNEILSLLVLLGILGLISTFLLKFYNILSSVQLYNIQLSIIVLSIGTFCYLFIEIGLFLNIAQGIEDSLLEYNIYYWFARVLFIMLWMFWFAEMIIYTAYTVAEPLDRMSKRKEERQQSSQFFRAN